VGIQADLVADVHRISQLDLAPIHDSCAGIWHAILHG